MIGQRKGTRCRRCGLFRGPGRRRRRPAGGHRCRDLQREMGHEGRRGGGGQDQSSAALAFSFFFGVRRLDAALPSSLVKNRSGEGATLSCLRQAGKNQRRKGGAPENRLAGRSVLHPPFYLYPACSNRRRSIDTRVKWSRQVSASSFTPTSWPRGLLIGHTPPPSTYAYP